jgi:hypothetical protein
VHRLLAILIPLIVVTLGSFIYGAYLGYGKGYGHGLLMSELYSSSYLRAQNEGKIEEANRREINNDHIRAAVLSHKNLEADLANSPYRLHPESPIDSAAIIKMLVPYLKANPEVLAPHEEYISGFNFKGPLPIEISQAHDISDNFLIEFKKEFALE